MRAVFSTIKIKPKQLITVVIFLLIAVVAAMFLPSMVSKMIDEGVDNSDTTLIIILAIVMAGLAVIAVIFNLLALRISSRISTDFCADLWEEIFVKVQSFSAAEIDKFGTASLTTRSTMENGDIKEVGDHDRLMKLGGKYADLYNSQFG